jgi:hypothetical protein
MLFSFYSAAPRLTMIDRPSSIKLSAPAEDAHPSSGAQRQQHEHNAPARTRDWDTKAGSQVAWSAAARCVRCPNDSWAVRIMEWACQTMIAAATSHRSSMSSTWDPASGRASSCIKPGPIGTLYACAGMTCGVPCVPDSQCILAHVPPQLAAGWTPSPLPRRSQRHCSTCWYHPHATYKRNTETHAATVYRWHGGIQWVTGPGEDWGEGH